MAKASSLAELNELHALVTRSYKERITQDLNDNIPTDAATLAGAVKFLKDNAVTADPADNDELSALRDKLKEAAQARKNNRMGNVIALADMDMQATG